MRPFQFDHRNSQVLTEVLHVGMPQQLLNLDRAGTILQQVRPAAGLMKILRWDSRNRKRPRTARIYTLIEAVFRPRGTRDKLYSDRTSAVTSPIRLIPAWAK